jgi:hypothetical protein
VEDEMNVYDAKVFDPKKTERVYLSAEADAAIAELVAAVKYFGRHDKTCEITMKPFRLPFPRCTCGLTAGIAKWEKKE